MATATNSSTDNSAGELRRRQLDQQDGGSSALHVYAENNESRGRDEDDEQSLSQEARARKTYGRTGDGRGE
jgi:hypothetical protein